MNSDPHHGATSHDQIQQQTVEDETKIEAKKKNKGPIKDKEIKSAKKTNKKKGSSKKKKKDRGSSSDEDDDADEEEEDDDKDCLNNALSKIIAYIHEWIHE